MIKIGDYGDIRRKTIYKCTVSFLSEGSADGRVRDWLRIDGGHIDCFPRYVISVGIGKDLERGAGDCVG